MGNCPLEARVAESLDKAGMPHEREKNGLDFYLPQLDLYIEIKQFHSNRIAEQMSRADNVIAVQGAKAVEILCWLIDKGLGHEP